ncbi:hypothetical protein [Kluyvera sp. Awk 3]|uniref:hypothetical protein n=1 Tax=Kluyvera sp. Awk 3 TaxID=2963956 RepID=UPI0023022817|nr:hypothetical protein [Kluyvera sp. Awk 3]MDA8487455.1 hypothetical protein [Kluyvera sp. Awk 3]
MTTFTKEQLKGWASRLIEETRSDISISRTDAHAESYHAQLELLEIALAALTAEPVADVVVWSSPNEERTCDIRWRRHDVAPGQLYRLPMIEGLK